MDHRPDSGRRLRVAVAGGGIAGLSAAWRLRRAGADVRLYEASNRVGGVIRSVHAGGFLIEAGPNTIVARDPAVPALIRDLGLEDALVRAPDAAAKRYVVRGRRPVPLPGGPADLLRTKLFSPGAKVRLAAEPIVPRGDTATVESVADFIKRRFGKEVLDYAADPFVSGVHAGDPELLAVRHAFPLLAELEKRHGSVLVGAAREMQIRRSNATPQIDQTPTSFLAGMEELPQALEKALDDSVHIGCRVLDVRSTDGAYELHIATAAGDRKERFDAVVLALPPDQLANLSIAAGRPAAALGRVVSPPVAVLGLGFRREDVGHPLDGFGILVPGAEPFRILGALFSSTLFPGRAPDGHVLLTCFLGGRRRPEDALGDEQAQRATAMTDLRGLLGVTAEPELVWRHVWQRAIPQYELDHGEVIDSLEELEARCARLAVAGSVRRGISVGETILSGLEAADRVLGTDGPS